MISTGRPRGFWKVFGLTLVTFGIYGIWFWFRVLREFEASFSFDPKGPTPSSVRVALVLSLCAGLLVPGLMVASAFNGHPLTYDQPGYWMLILLSAIPGAWFALQFIDLLRIAQAKAQVGPSGSGSLRHVYLASVGVSLIPYVGLLGTVLGLIWFARLLHSINEIWDCGVPEMEASPISPSDPRPGARPVAPIAPGRDASH